MVGLLDSLQLDMSSLESAGVNLMTHLLDEKTKSDCQNELSNIKDLYDRYDVSQNLFYVER